MLAKSGGRCWGLLRKVWLSSRVRKSLEEQNGGLGCLGLGIPGLTGRLGGATEIGEIKGRRRGQSTLGLRGLEGLN